MARFRTFINAMLITAVLAATGVIAAVSFKVTPDAVRIMSNQTTVAQEVVYTDDDGCDPQVDGAKIVIHAPETAKVGELVRFDVSASKANSFKWILVPESVDFEVYSEGRRAVFSAREEGEYMFIVACAYEGTVDVKTHTVIVGKPGPDPSDYPKVPRPDSEAGVVEWIPYWCSLTLRPRDEVVRLAESFEGVAATIAAGVHTTPDEIIKATGEANRQALEDSVEEWKPFLLSLQNEFKKQANAGTLVSPEQHAEMWREVAAGLRAYADLFETLSINN